MIASTKAKNVLQSYAVYMYVHSPEPKQF